MLNDLLATLLSNLTFFATGFGILLIGSTALLSILLWDWRVTLLCLLVVQVGVAVLATQIHNFPEQWGSAQVLVTALAAAMLLLSARQVRPVLRQQRPGSFVIRLSALILFVVSWQFIEFDLTLPLLTRQEADLFLWLALCAFVMLGLSDSPLYTAVALLLWLIPVQAFIQVILPEQQLFVFIGIGELLLALAASYLLLAQRVPHHAQSRVLTDITFPEELPLKKYTAPRRTRPLPALPQAATQRPPLSTVANPGGPFLPEGPTGVPPGERGQDTTEEHPVVARRQP